MEKSTITHKESPVFLGDNLYTITAAEMQNFPHGMLLQQKPDKKQGVGAEQNK